MEFPGVSGRSDIVKLARDFTPQLFERFDEFIVMKARHLHSRSAVYEEYEALVND